MPDDLFVCHHCDNPPCCNPAHLYVGTAAENNGDKARRGRAPRTVGEAHPGAKLTEDQVREIRRRVNAGGEYRKDIAAEFGICASMVSRIMHRRAWTHIE